MRLFFTRNIGFILLGIYLILVGLTPLVPLTLPSMVFAILALLSGIFILIGR